jgi:hypothetical protein
MYNPITGSKKLIILLSKALWGEAMITEKVENTFQTWATWPWVRFERRTI